MWCHSITAWRNHCDAAVSWTQYGYYRALELLSTHILCMIHTWLILLLCVILNTTLLIICLKYITYSMILVHVKIQQCGSRSITRLATNLVTSLETTWWQALKQSLGDKPCKTPWWQKSRPPIVGIWPDRFPYTPAPTCWWYNIISEYWYVPRYQGNTIHSGVVWIAISGHFSYHATKAHSYQNWPRMLIIQYLYLKIIMIQGMPWSNCVHEPRHHHEQQRMSDRDHPTAHMCIENLPSFLILCIRVVENQTKTCMWRLPTQGENFPHEEMSLVGDLSLGERTTIGTML